MEQSIHEACAAPTLLPPNSEADTWQVCFNGYFGESDPHHTPGKELVLNKQFMWGELPWCIPSVYICEEGLVLDIYTQIPLTPLRAFFDKWNPTLPPNGSARDNALDAQMSAENPQELSFCAEVTVDGESLSRRRGCGFFWVPFSEAHQDHHQKVLAHYGLDPALAWNFQRRCFAWGSAPLANIASLSVCLQRNAIETPGSRFSVSAAGEQVVFTHPFTGVQHTLTVQEYEHKEMDADPISGDGFEQPHHFFAIAYTVVPNLPKDAFTVRDTAQSDAPRRIGEASSIIGGSVGVILCGTSEEAVQFGGSEQGEISVAASSLSFEPAKQVEWFMLFRDTPVPEDITVALV